MQPPQAKKPCPYCGAMKIGLADHIRDKHTPQGVAASILGHTPRGGVMGKRRPQPRRITTPQLDCPECGEPMRLKEGHYGLFYGCTAWQKTGCKGSHGARPNGEPLGIPADDRTKKMRMAAHNALDPLWNSPEPVFESRARAYHWMQTVLSMNSDEAHIGRFGIDECKQLIEAIWDAFGEDEVTA